MIHVDSQVTLIKSPDTPEPSIASEACEVSNSPLWDSGGSERNASTWRCQRVMAFGTTWSFPARTAPYCSKLPRIDAKIPRRFTRAPSGPPRSEVEANFQGDMKISSAVYSNSIPYMILKMHFCNENEGVMVVEGEK